VERTAAEGDRPFSLNRRFKLAIGEETP
jgi:hypothetical protein